MENVCISKHADNQSATCLCVCVCVSLSKRKEAVLECFVGSIVRESQPQLCLVVSTISIPCAPTGTVCVYVCVCVC